jgi:hypothetical protein
MTSRTTPARSCPISPLPRVGLSPSVSTFYVRRKRAEASGGNAQLDPEWLKPERNVSATSNFRQPKPRGDGHGASDGENPNPKQPVRGDTLPYNIQREIEGLGIGADYLRENDLGLFHLGVLGRLMRCVPSVCVVKVTIC